MPESLRGLDADGRAKVVHELTERRAALQREIQALEGERQQYLQENAPAELDEGLGNALERAIDSQL